MMRSLAHSTEYDTYVTRTRRPLPMIERLDPVVYGNAGSGPLSEDELARYERDGFLFYEGFFSAEELAAWVEELRRLCYDPALARAEGVIREPESEEVDRKS